MRGPKVFKGYWRDPDATAAAFAGGWFHTGDIGVRDNDGYLYIVDRLKDMIVSGGENIASSEIERVLYEHPSVLEAAVVGRPDDRWGEVPVAFVALRQGADATPDLLIEHCRAQLARFKVPKAVMFVDALPRNPSGKVLTRASPWNVNLPHEPLAQEVSLVRPQLRTTTAPPSSRRTAPTGGTMAVNGPVTGGSKGWAFGGPAVDFAALGYQQEEYFFEGEAARYGPAPGTQLGRDGRWQVAPVETSPYETSDGDRSSG